MQKVNCSDKKNNIGRTLYSISINIVTDDNVNKVYMYLNLVVIIYVLLINMCLLI